MSLYYIKQDNTIWGCGEPGCCGEYNEEIDEAFVKCEHGIPEEQMTADHLQACYGGGDVIEWRKADVFEALAFNDGRSEGFQEGSNWGIEYQKKQEENNGNK